MTDRVSTRARKILFILLLMTGDYGAFFLALFVSYWVRVKILGPWFHIPLIQSFGDFAVQLWMPAIVLGMFLYEGLYTRRLPFWEETQKVLRALLFAFMGILAVVTLDKLSKDFSRAVILETGFLCAFLIPSFRTKWKPYLHRRGLGVEKVLIVGEEKAFSVVASGLDRDHYMGLRAIGWMNEPSVSEEIEAGESDMDISGQSVSGNTSFSSSYLGSLKSLPGVIQEKKVYSLIVAYPMLRAKTLSKMVSEIQKHVYSVYVIPNLSQVNLLSSELLYFFYEEVFLLRIRNNLKSRLNRDMKSILDYAGTCLLTIFLFPVMGVIAVGVAVSSPGPVFFTQPRMGRNGKPFRIFKFRTMYEDAESRLQEILESDPKLKVEYQRNRKLRNDPRITAIGRFLRRTSLDELPQLLNVLRGEMSLVGPRPAFEEEILEHYKEQGSEYALVKPGITGLWQVSGRNENDFSVRVRLDLWYIRNWSLWLDLMILVRTVGVVLSRKGAV